MRWIVGAVGARSGKMSREINAMRLPTFRMNLFAIDFPSGSPPALATHKKTDCSRGNLFSSRQHDGNCMSAIVCPNNFVHVVANRRNKKQTHPPLRDPRLDEQLELFDSICQIAIVCSLV